MEKNVRADMIELSQSRLVECMALAVATNDSIVLGNENRLLTASQELLIAVPMP